MFGVNVAEEQLQLLLILFVTLFVFVSMSHHRDHAGKDVYDR